MISDKQIGGLWRTHKQHFRMTGCYSLGAMLIRKLVEERAWKNAVRYYKVHGPDDDAVKSCIVSSLRDFGIDKKDWRDEV